MKGIRPLCCSLNYQKNAILGTRNPSFKEQFSILFTTAQGITAFLLRYVSDLFLKMSISIKTEFREDIRERGSRFLSYLFPVWDDGVFEARLSHLRKEFYDATHHCSALIRFGNPNQEHAHDDGEPAGTAGLPILNAMRSAQLVNAGIVVIRYFGGTKLGKSGLIETYGWAAESVINMAQTYPVRSATTLRVLTHYDKLKTLEMIIQRTGAERLSSNYLQDVEIILRIDEEQTGYLEQQLDEVAYIGIQYERLGTGLMLEGA